MVVSTSGFGYPSAVVDVVVMSFGYDIVLETSGSRWMTYLQING